MNNAPVLQFSIFNLHSSIQRLAIASFIVTALVSVPSFCAAENVTTWEFQNQIKIEGFETFNFASVQLRDEGLALSAEADGQLVHVSDIRHAVDIVSITYTSLTGGTGIFFWRAPGMEANDVYQIPIDFAQSTSPQDLVLDLTQINVWDARSDRMGFVIHAGTQITLHHVDLSGPGIFDRIWYPLKTFFNLYDAKASSVNFLWGPLMTFGEYQLEHLYSTVPPSGYSWNIVFYLVLAIALAAALVAGKLKKTARPLALFCMLFAGLWLLYDLRMGSELIGFAQEDMQTWWSQPPELKSFRDRRSFTEFTQLVPKLLEGQSRYVFVASQGWPFTGSMRYATYPALPLSLEEYQAMDPEEQKAITQWIVYDRTDIKMDADRQLTLDGVPISTPGGVIMSFEPGSFMFVTTSQ